MSLRIRRGTDAQRQTLTFDQGEVVYTTDTKKVYVGDGITQGGVNILANSAGVGVTFNGTTQAFDFSTNNLGLTTSVISEGTNKYYTTQRAQDAAASLFTSVGSPTSTGSVTGTITPSTIVLAVAPTNMVQGERIVISGTGGNGLSATTYYVVSVNSANVVLASTLANAMASTPVPISSLTTGSITGTTYAAGATDTGITFTYDSINHVMNVTASGVTSIVNDTSPSLGGNLAIGNYNITSSGTGAISIAGGITTTGTITASTGLGADLSLNSRSITGTGNISIAGRLAITNSGQEVSQFVGQNSTGSGVTTPQINMYTSRGTVSSPTASQPGDYLANLSFGGYKSGAYFQAVNFISILDSAANMSNASPAGGLGIAINDNAGGNSIFRFSYQGVLTAPVFQATSYTTTNMNAIPNPAAGMIVFNSTVNHFCGYNGTAWVAFTGP